MLGNIITITIVLSIILLFILSIGKSSKHNFKNEIVSLGVLGTFIGIALGLYKFNVTDLATSMPLLLEGLKTAFITSGFGMFFSIIISINRPIKDSSSQTLEALELVVKDFNTNLTQQFGDNFKLLNESVKSMIEWQNGYKNQITQNEKSLNNIFNQLKEIELMKVQEQERIRSIMVNLEYSSKDVKNSLQETTNIVKEQMQLLLREANRSL